MIRIASAVTLGLLISSVGPGTAWPLCVDQANDQAPASGGFVIPGGAPVGQTFTPRFTFLDFVELTMNSQSPTVGGTAFVRIRSGGLIGPILGTSQTVTLPPGGTPLTVAHFDFVLPPTLTPGLMYLIEVVATSGSLGVFVTGWGTDPYSGGYAIFQGTPRLTDDLWFREGRNGPSAVEPASWGGIKAVYR
jgi:hypothetical protein